MFPHATPNGYNLGCRCVRCTKSNTNRMRERREHVRTLRKLIDGRWVSPYAKHGTLNGYGYWQCRCWLCTEIHSKKLKERYRKEVD